MGFDYIHSAVDDHTRLAYSEVHGDEKAATCAAFLRRAYRSTTAESAEGASDAVQRPSPGKAAGSGRQVGLYAGFCSSQGDSRGTCRHPFPLQCS